MTKPQYTSARPCAAPDCPNSAYRHERYCCKHRSRLRRLGSVDLPTTSAHVWTSLADLPAMPGEEWRAIAGYENLYDVSSYGRVASLRTGVVLRHYLSDGYPRVKLISNGNTKRAYIHHLVAVAFLGPRPPGKEVNHIDCDRTNARADNLEYLTHAENVAHCVKAGRAYGQKLSVEDVLAIRASSENPHTLAARYNIRVKTLKQILMREKWKHLA